MERVESSKVSTVRKYAFPFTVAIIAGFGALAHNSFSSHNKSITRAVEVCNGTKPNNNEFLDDLGTQGVYYIRYGTEERLVVDVEKINNPAHKSITTIALPIDFSYPCELASGTHTTFPKPKNSI